MVTQATACHWDHTSKFHLLGLLGCNDFIKQILNPQILTAIYDTSYLVHLFWASCLTTLLYCNDLLVNPTSRISSSSPSSLLQLHSQGRPTISNAGSAVLPFIFKGHPIASLTFCFMLGKHCMLICHVTIACDSCGSKLGTPGCSHRNKRNSLCRDVNCYHFL